MIPIFKKIFHVDNIKSFYEKYERHIGSLTLVLGFVFDSVVILDAKISTQTITFIVYLFVAGLSILALCFVESRKKDTQSYSKTHFWFFLLMQFAIGSLFSMFFVFYSRGVSIATSWPFLLLLFVNLVGNEAFKKHYIHLPVQISLFFIALFSFSIYFVPVLAHQIGVFVFIISGVTSLVLIFGFVRLLSLIDSKRTKENQNRIVIGISIIYLLINIFYFTNIIPPVPLVMKQGGVYHYFTRDPFGNYVVYQEEKPRWSFLESYPVFNRTNNESVYVVTAVYAPTALDTEIIHDWQYFDKKTNGWKSVDKIRVSITGGREGGYRLYSMKQSIETGLWRVDVKTAQGQIVGRIRFEVMNASISPLLEEKIY